MRSIVIFTLIFLGLGIYSFTVVEPHFHSSIGDTEKPNHFIWNEILEKNVSQLGNVNYEGIAKDNLKLKNYLKLLSSSNPFGKNWTKEDKLAFWINTYNAYTVKLILDNYPIKSIKDIKSPWHKEFFQINGKTMNLNAVEHEILRKLGDPRIHFGIVCASYSCPILRAEAYSSQKIDEQLNDQAKRFINDLRRNKIDANKAQLSKIFSWFKKDFTKNGNLINYINKYSKVKVNLNAKVSYLDYNWSLNK